jgi:hypothetical protein
MYIMPLSTITLVFDGCEALITLGIILIHGSFKSFYSFARKLFWQHKQ